MAMAWTAEMVEDVMNFIRVVKGAEQIHLFYLDNDVIAYTDDRGIYHSRFFSSLYKEMLDNQNKW